MIPAGLDDLIPMDVLAGTLWALIVAVWALLLLGGICFLAAGICCLVATAKERGFDAGKILRTKQAG